MVKNTLIFVLTNYGGTLFGLNGKKYIENRREILSTFECTLNLGQLLE